MKIQNFILIIISFIKISTSLPSDNIWIKALSYIEEGKMIINENKTHFIFDESNYTALDINGQKMNILYEKQEKIFKKYNMSNYIFIVDNLDEKEETIESATFNLCKYLYNTYKINMEKSIVALFSIESRRVRIRTGEITKKYLDNDKLKTMIQNLVPFLKYEHYYKAWNKFLEDVYYYYNKNDKWETYLLWLLIICYIGYNGIKKIIGKRIVVNRSISLDNDKNLKRIIDFLKKQKSNKKILTDNCAICLEEFKVNQNNKNEENDMEDSSNTVRKIEENKDILTLECGHQFHNDCISKWMERKNECPLCRQKINSKYNKDDAHMVWGVQNDLYDNHYSFINYYDLFTTTTFIDYSSYEVHEVKNEDSYDSSHSNNYSFGGGSDCGGGATGGW